MAKFISLNDQIINLDHIVRIEMTKTQESSVAETPVDEPTGSATTAYLKSSSQPEAPQIQFKDTGFLIKIHLSSGHHISLDLIKKFYRAEELYLELEQLLGAEKIIIPAD
ncbi:hypothetical protein [Psychrobacter sp. W2-37-MNA-CIBAN-0211]|uniref:hypothetical protein n=1 Tax=Psychrobacter sp. W2-37-MNA-CIBAN-0211 TaxID=3140443 RepID=UPI00331F1766